MTSASQTVLKRFIVLEGGDGSGTTTQLKRIGDALKLAGVQHWITAEPTDRPEGILIRRVLSGELKRDPGTLARLFAADRNEHLRGEDGIFERLERGEAVICDRYVLSSLAYQGVACGPELPALLNSGFPLPELLIYFDIAPEQSIERLNSRESLDIFEKLPFQERVQPSPNTGVFLGSFGPAKGSPPNGQILTTPRSANASEPALPAWKLILSSRS